MANQLLGAGWFLMTPEKVARDSRLNKLQQNIYSELYTFQNATPNQAIWISNNKLAEKYNVARESISRAISKLVEYGYIKRELVYKENSKQVDRRLIRVVPIDEVINRGSDQNVKGVVTDTSIGWCPERQGGSDQNVKENIPSNIPINKPMNIPEGDDEQVINKSVEKTLNKNAVPNQKQQAVVVTKRLLPLVNQVDSVQDLNAMFDKALTDSVEKSKLGTVMKPVSYAVTTVTNAVKTGAKNYDQFLILTSEESILENQEVIPDIPMDINLLGLDVNQLDEKEAQ